MAVFTQLTEGEVAELLRTFSLGKFLALTPIESGIENTNYFLTTEGSKWVLTVFERLKAEELPFYLELCEHLAKKGCRVARPQKTRTGELFTYVHGKPVAIADCLPGEQITTVTVTEARSMGDLLAKMHRAVRDFPLVQKNLRGLDWWIQTAPKVRPFLNAGQQALCMKSLHAKLRFQKPMASRPLRSAPVTAIYLKIMPWPKASEPTKLTSRESLTFTLPGARRRFLTLPSQ